MKQKSRFMKITRTKQHNFFPGMVTTAIGFVLGCLSGLALAGESAAGPLRIHPDNPRYFTDGSGKAIYLTGSHTWGNLQEYRQPGDKKPFDYTGYLDFLEKHNHNFIRLWTWESPRSDCKQLDLLNSRSVPMSYQRTGPGNAADGGLKFDVTKFNPAYFDRLRSRVIEAGKRGIYVNVMLFQGWSVWNFSGAKRNRDTWSYHPFNKNNNTSGIDGDPNGNGEGEEVHSLQIPEITRLQQAYIRKVIDTVNDLDNVLFEISNETKPNKLVKVDTKAWEYAMVRYVKQYEAGKPKQHPVGVTANAVIDTDVLDSSPSDWVSLRKTRKFPYGDKRLELACDPPIADGRKVSILDTDHIGVQNVEEPTFTRAWVWKSFLREHNPIYMEMHQNNPMNDLSSQHVAGRKAMGCTRTFANKMNLVEMTPHNDLASTKYCLASPGKEYLVYLPDGGKVTVDLSASKEALSVEWFDPSSGEVKKVKAVRGGGRRDFTAPFGGDAVLYFVHTMSKQ